MFPCHRFRKRRSPEEVQKWLDEHKEEILAELLAGLPELERRVRQLEESKRVSSDMMNLRVTV